MSYTAFGVVPQLLNMSTASIEIDIPTKNRLINSITTDMVKNIVASMFKNLDKNYYSTPHGKHFILLRVSDGLKLKLFAECQPELCKEYLHKASLDQLSNSENKMLEKRYATENEIGYTIDKKISEYFDKVHIW